MLCHSAKKPVTTVLTYPWKCTVLHCNHLGNTWKPLVLMTRHFDYCPSASELARWLLAFLCCVSYYFHYHTVTCLRFVSYCVLCFINVLCNTIPSTCISCHGFICVYYLCLYILCHDKSHLLFVPRYAQCVHDCQLYVFRTILPPMCI